MEIELVAIEELIVLPLILDVLVDSLFIDADSGNEIAPAPETLLGEGAFSGEGIVGFDGTLALEKTHGISHRMLGRNAHAMCM